MRGGHGLFVDGLFLDAGSAVSARLRLVLGQGLADVPEGFSVVAKFRDKGLPRMRQIAKTDYCERRIASCDWQRLLSCKCRVDLAT